MAYRAGAEITGKEFSGGVTYSRRETERQQEARTGNGLSGEIIDDSYRYPFALGGGLSEWYTRPT